jgi:hypothetical protein
LKIKIRDSKQASVHIHIFPLLSIEIQDQPFTQII